MHFLENITRKKSPLSKVQQSVKLHGIDVLAYVFVHTTRSSLLFYSQTKQKPRRYVQWQLGYMRADPNGLIPSDKMAEFAGRQNMLVVAYSYQQAESSLVPCNDW